MFRDLGSQGGRLPGSLPMARISLVMSRHVRQCIGEPGWLGVLDGGDDLGPDG